MTCKKVTYESDRRLLKKLEGDYWVCVTFEIANLHICSDVKGIM